MKEKKGKGAQSAFLLPFLMMPVQKKSSRKIVDGPVEAESSNPKLRVRAKNPVVAKRSTDPSSITAGPPTKRVRNYKKHAKKELSEAFPEIVGVLIERAKKGSLTHAKLLFELGGVKDERLSRRSRPGHASLAEILLKEVAKRNETAAEADCAKHQETQAQQYGPRAADTRNEDKG